MPDQRLDTEITGRFRPSSEPAGDSADRKRARKLLTDGLTAIQVGAAMHAGRAK